ncbi:MAG: peptidylprolyl isomerase [Dehalococcoidia bacterium]|nr:peptidylprolyl isomerase [Dehalococcoidia bacterium]
MVGSSRAASRRQEEAAQARRDRLLLLGTIGVLAVTAVVVLVGVYLTVYRPPRDVVAAVGGRNITAADVVDRASFYMVSEGGAFNTRPDEDLPGIGVDRAVRDLILLRDAPSLVDEVSSEDIDAKIQEALGGGLEGDALKRERDRIVKRAGIDVPQYREIMKATLLAERLTAHFSDELPATLPQRHLERVRTPSRVNAERVIERGRAGESFDALVRQYGADRRIDVDQDWLVDELLLPEARLAAEGLAPGQISEVSPSGLFFDVYRVVEVDPDRALTDEQKDTIAERRLKLWVQEQRGFDQVNPELPASASKWIADRVAARVRDAFRAQAEDAKAKR